MLSAELKNFLNQKLSLPEFAVPAETQEQFASYLELLIKWNAAYNLTSVRDPEQMVVKHLLDSLSVRPHLSSSKRILDVGTGGGFPGIPLALMEPDREFVLLDSNGKKTRFLTHVVQTLKLKNVHIVQARVESFQTDINFDIIITRAFSTLAKFIEFTQHLCCASGSWLAMKGEHPTEEIAELPSEFLVMVYDLQVPELNAQRHLVCIKKNIDLRP